MGRYSWPIIRRLKALKPTDRVLFLFYFSRHKLETSYNDAQAKKIHESMHKRSLDHGSRLTEKGF